MQLAANPDLSLVYLHVVEIALKLLRKINEMGLARNDPRPGNIQVRWPGLHHQFCSFLDTESYNVLHAG